MSAEVIVTAPPLSVMVTFVPAVKARVSLLPRVLPPAVMPLHVFVSVSVEAIVTAPPLSVMVTLEPAVKANVSLVLRVLPPAVTVLQVLSFAVISSTTRSIVPSPSSQVTAILVSVLLLNIAPTMSCTASVES